MGEFDLPFMRKQKSIEQLQEENERLSQESQNEDLQLTIAQKQALRRKLEENGMTLKRDFSGSLRRAWKWANKTN